MPLRFAVRSLAVSLLAAVPLALAAAPAGAVLPADSTVILSGAPSLLAPLPAPVADSVASRQAVSQDGRFVAFASKSDGLSSEDDDGAINVYVRDRLTGTTTLVSRASGANGEPTHRGCSNPAISDDGTRVAFSCDGPLDPVDTNGRPDVYLRDLTTDQTILVSRLSGAGEALGASSSAPALDEHGTHVAFASSAQFIPGVQGQQVYLRDVPLDPQQAGSGTLTLVSRGDGATANLPNAFSSDPSISDDGTKVAFLSRASNIATGATSGTNDVFVRDVSISPATTTLVSRQSAADGGVEADRDSNDAMISGNGATVAFASTATNLDPAVNSALRLHVYKRSGQTTTLVDRQLNGTGAGNGDAQGAAIDDGGKVIAFSSTATNLVDPALDPDPAADIYAYDARSASPAIELVSRASGASSPAANRVNGEPPPSVSGDGAQVLFATDGSVTGDALPGIQTLALRDLSSDTTSAVVLPTGATGFGNQGGDSNDASISADGRFVAFQTNAPALGVPSTARSEIVVRDTVTGATTLASREDGIAGAPMTGTSIGKPSLSADGRRVAFEADDARGVRSIWVRDLATGTTILASDGIGGAPADGLAFGPSISADGTHVGFVSSATNLVAGVTGGTNAYVRDLGPGGATVLASSDGAGGTANVNAVALDRDGTRIAFVTPASLVGQDTDGLDDLYVRDLTPAGQTVLASVGPDGANSDQDAEDPAISADGTHVAFDTSSGNLGRVPPAGGTEVWVRDLRPGGTITLASRADGATGAPATGESSTPALSTDGHVAAFVSRADNLFPGAGLPNPAVYRRDLAAGTTRLVSRAPGPDGAFVPAQTDASKPVAVTADGGCVTFSGHGDVLGPVPGALDYEQAYLRTFEPDCGRPVPIGPRDRTPPVLRSVSLTHKRFRVGKARTAVSAAVAAAAAKRKPAIPRGTLLRFRSSEAGRLSIRIERARPGQKVRKGRKLTCKAVRRRPKRGACTAYARVATLTRTIKAGHGQVALSGRVGKRALAPGSYRLTLTERDKAGNLSKAVRLSFTILRG